VALAEWLKNHNQSREQKIGFYGLDVYGLWESLEAIAKFVEERYPEALESTKKAIECFEPYGGDEGRDYARASQLAPQSCHQEVVDMLTELRKSMEHHKDDREAAFCAEQNALVAVNAEKFYRSMLSLNDSSWNVRDHHMMETLNRLADFHGPESKAIVWEHNTHVGDARATDMAEEGLFNLGQLAREHHKKEVFIVGFGNYKGTVIAGDEWGAPMEEMLMPEAREDSWENMLHETGEGDMLLFSDDLKEIDAIRNNDIPHRAVGVVYHPWLEKSGNYVPSRILKRYDAFMFYDVTKAVHPLHVVTDAHKTPLTYPWEE
jgi:erythromycin esterase